MYGNLVNDMLGNSSRDSRSTRGGHRRDDRGQSVYEGERDGVDAIDRDGLSLLGITLVETGTYDPEFLRPYVVSSTRDDIDQFADVVAEEGADKAAIEEAIKTMPNYFDEYDTTVTFITEEELKANHSKMPHGGFVIRTGETGCEGNKHVIEYSLKLDSNPEFTGSVLVAYARAAHRLSKKGECGARSVFDIAPAMLSQMSAEELRAHML